MKRMNKAVRIASVAWLLSGTVLAQTAPAPITTAAATDATPASLWSRLWRTPDQRGQALLQQGDAAGAAQTFTDPQRKGHAALQAHDYTGAAKALSGIDTAEAHYNRGNALAHTGDLQGAISAYEAALKHNPQHTDARHNRDVVAAKLKKQKDEKKDSSPQDPQEDQDKKDQDGGKGGKGDKPTGKANEKPGNSEPQHSDTSGKNPEKQPGQPPSAKPADQPASAAPAAPPASPKDDAAQARRDAESSLGKGAPPSAPPQSGVATPVTGQPGPRDTAAQPLTEKQIAQEQWLQAIPDDPGGLLRRKFLMQHMLRQQGQKP